MNKYIFLFILFWSFNINADSTIIYVNGILNSKAMAADSAKKIKKLLDASNNHSAVKRKFKVVYIWNPTGWSPNSPSYADVGADAIELFLLKTSEEHYIDDLDNIISPFNQGRIIDKSSANNVAQYFYDLTPGNNEVEDSIVSIDDSMRVTKNTIGLLVEEIKRNSSSIVVAHSQGNLLANLAYAELVSELGNDIYKKVRVVNVANVSNASVSALNFTHAGDAALYDAAAKDKPVNASLESMAVKLKWYRETPACIPPLKYCLFNVAPPTFDAPEKPIPDQPVKDQLLDHGFVDTYLSKAIVVTFPRN